MDLISWSYVKLAAGFKNSISDLASGSKKFLMEVYVCVELLRRSGQKESRERWA